MSMKPKAVCVLAVEFSHDIANWKVQGHSYSYIYMLDHFLLH